MHFQGTERTWLVARESSGGSEMLTTSLNGQPHTPPGNQWQNYSFYNWAAHMHHALLNAYKLPLQCTLTVAVRPAASSAGYCLLWHCRFRSGLQAFSVLWFHGKYKDILMIKPDHSIIRPFLYVRSACNQTILHFNCKWHLKHQSDMWAFFSQRYFN